MKIFVFPLGRKEGKKKRLGTFGSAISSRVILGLLGSAMMVVATVIFSRRDKYKVRTSDNIAISPTITIKIK
jgi:hypothetical protein